MITIYDSKGNGLLEVLITKECMKTEELMASDFIQLSWNSTSNEILKAGSYIDYEGERYYLLDNYKPTQKDELEYKFTPHFHSRVMLWQKQPFFLYTKENGIVISKEPDWTLTSNARTFMECVQEAIEEYTGEKWYVVVADGLPASAFLHFENTDIFSALNSIANAFETEWYADKKHTQVNGTSYAGTLYLGRAEYGETAILEVGENIGIPSVTSNGEGYFNRFYAFGSTRNITQDMKTGLTNSIANKRLTLDPNKYPNGYYDDVENGEVLSPANTFVKMLYFDNIYPRATDGKGSKGLKVTKTKVRLKYRFKEGTDEKIILGYDNGEPIYETYPIWYIRFDGFVYDKSKEIAGLIPTMSFESGALQGREFEYKYHDKAIAPDKADANSTPIAIEAGDFEIFFKEENGIIIPSATGLVPTEDDEVALFNIELPDEYVRIAREELETAMFDAIAESKKDYNTYSFKSNPVAFNENNPNLSIGRKVKYINNGYELVTRVQSLKVQLDYSFEQEISIGNAVKKGNISELKEEVASANNNIDLITALNKQTQGTIEAYRRTQEAVNEGLAKVADMWTFHDEDTIISKYNVASAKAISARGVDKTQGEGGGGSGEGEGGLDVSQLWNELRASDSSKIIDESHIPSSIMRKSEASDFLTKEDLMWKNIRNTN